jgi:hypothetical protein
LAATFLVLMLSPYDLAFPMYAVTQELKPPEGRSKLQ